MDLVGGRIIAQKPDLHRIYFLGAGVKLPVANCLIVVRLVEDKRIGITLPPIAESVGLIISVLCASLPGTSYVDIDSDASGYTTITLDALSEHTTLYCDGLRWHELASNHA